MISFKKCLKYAFLIIFIEYFETIYCENFNYGMKYTKVFRLNNGNIMIIGDIGIHTYDRTGLLSLYNCSLIETITNEENCRFISFAQFSETYNSIVIVIVMDVIYIFDDKGSHLFNYELDNIYLSDINYYDIVPHIYKDEKYFFVFGYRNNNQKAYIQYLSFEIEEEAITVEDYYEFPYICAQGITCQFMDYHNNEDNTDNEVLSCFYSNNEGISANNFQIQNNKFKIFDLNTTYYDKAFIMLSQISKDKKKCLICYIKDIDITYQRYGYCIIYNIQSNNFHQFDINYSKKEYGTTLNNINLNYFKETREYIFSFRGYDAEITLIRFNDDFEIIENEDNSQEYKILFNTECQMIYTFSFVFISNEYQIIGHFSCNGNEMSSLHSIPSEYKPVVIYTELSGDNSNTKTSVLSVVSSTFLTNMKSSVYKTSILNTRTTQPQTRTTQPQTKTTQPDTRTTQPQTRTTNIKIKTTVPKKTIYSSPTSILSSQNNIKSSTLITKTTLSSTNLNVNTLVTNPPKTTICNGYRDNEGTICTDTIPMGYYLLDDLNNIIEKCDYICKSCQKRNEDNKIICLICKENFELNIDNNCLYKYNYYYDHENKKNIYLPKDQLCPEYYPFEIVETKECVESCEIMEFINKLCFINNFSQNNLNNITEKMKKIINEVDDINYDVIIDGNNIIYEITTSSVKTDHQNISFIDFGECEKILKSHYIIDYLLVFKIDIKLNESCPLDVEYEVYSPETKQKLNMSLCENKNIDIYVPISIDNQTNDLYNSMSQQGVDILNENNSFYNDLCMPFTSDEGTDISLSDRQDKYYNEKITLCEDNCEYMGYNSTNKKAKCQCKIKKEITEIKVISYDHIGVRNFLDIKTITNIEIMKCYKLTFSLDGLSNNYGFMILSVSVAFFISLIIIYFLTKKTSVSRIIRTALNINIFNNPPRKLNISIVSRHDSKISKINSEKSLNSINKQQSQSIRELIDTNNIVINNNPERKNTNLQINNFQNINVIKKANFILDNKSISLYPKKKKKKKKKKKSNLNDIHIYNINNTINESKGGKRKKKKRKKKLHRNQKDKIIIYTEQELNLLPYNKAKTEDKRTYCQYYWSLLKHKHIILFIFMPYNDYNLIITKIGLLIFSFSLYFTVNAFFFTDETMHKIYEDKGIYNFLYQLPSIIYSNLISTVINVFVKTLALSDKIVLQFKEMNNKKTNLPKEKIVELYNNLIMKFNIYFGITLSLLCFCWYYTSTFCAVYKNTQISLISNTLSSFSLSLIYPFGLTFLPGIFRFPALKSNENKECLYEFGNILALI